MAPTFDIVATAPDRVKADLLAVPVFTGGLLGPGADAVDAALGGTLAAFMTEAGFEAKRGETLSVPTSGQLGAKAAVLVGMGGRANAKLRAGIARGARIAEGVAWARDLVNEPAAAKSPDAIAKLARTLARANGLSIKVLAGEQLERERLGGVLGVGKGSERPPRFVRLAYEPKGARSTIAFVGKGVVFDSGGLSIKTAGGMETMKTDMSGGAAVIAAMSTLRDLDVKTRVIGFVPLVENMPSGDAMRPGDVLRMRNGKTVEVLNTDAEGRLILADGLSLAAEEKPDAIIDLATLTGACVVALGEKIAGLMTTNDSWGEQVRAAADNAGEPVWPLPLPKEYNPLIESEIADLKNIGTGGYGGALTAGLFLAAFVGDVPWVHLDIAGPARAGKDDGVMVRGGTGFGVRTLARLLTDYKKPTATNGAR